MFSEFEKRGLTEHDLQILRAVCHDINSVEMAPHLNIKPRSVRNRRERAINKARKILLQIDDLD
jgi:FixJ family two-component response regulator